MQQRKRYNNNNNNKNNNDYLESVDDRIPHSRNIDRHHSHESTRRRSHHGHAGVCPRHRRQRWCWWWEQRDCHWNNNQNDNQNIHKKGRRKRFLVTILLLALLIIVPLVLYLFVLHPYAWVYRRCFVARIVEYFSSQRQVLSQQIIACQEAQTHQNANADPTLLWPSTLAEAHSRLSSEQIRNMQSVETKLRQRLASADDNHNIPSVQNIHYTITAPISNASVRSLGLCNLEAMTRFCTEESTTTSSSSNAASKCRINLWIVDRAALAWNSEVQEWNSIQQQKQQQQEKHNQRTDSALDTPLLVSYVLEMIVLMERVFAAAPGNIKPVFRYCIRIIPDPMAYQDENLAHTWIENLANYHGRAIMNGKRAFPSVFKLQECPPPTWRSRTAGRRMREWLNTSTTGTPADTTTTTTNIRKEPREPAAQQQHHQQLIPEHASDAWRLVALLEWGGLYLDLDVIPFTSRLMHLPCETVPTQHRIGAYRVNGGVLRLGDSSICSSVHTTHVTEDDDGSRNDTSSPGCFLQALEADHLWWAPRLARLSEVEQTFGFLGPGALTRVAISSACRKDGQLTVLPDDVIEPVIDATICARIQTNKTTLAAHFSRSKKTIWWPLVTRYPCLEMKVRSVCPETTSELDESSESE
jgi:hypothetical protein